MGLDGRPARRGLLNPDAIPCPAPLWLEYLDLLDGLRRPKARALRTLWDEASIGVGSHQIDVFILEPGTDRYLGRLCDFNACSKGKSECRVPGCGNVALLRQHEGFRWRAESLAQGRRSGYSSNRQVCSAARAICHLSRSMLGDEVPDGSKRCERTTLVFSLTPGRSSRAGVRGSGIEDDRRRSSPACS